MKIFAFLSPYIEHCNSFGSRVHVVHVQQDFMEIRHSSMFRLETRDGSKDALLELSLVAQFMICVDFVQFQFILALSQWSDKRQNKRTFFFSFFFCFSTEAFRRRRCRSGKLLFYISFNTIRKLKGEKKKRNHLETENTEGEWGFCVFSFSFVTSSFSIPIAAWNDVTQRFTKNFTHLCVAIRMTSGISLTSCYESDRDRPHDESEKHWKTLVRRRKYTVEDVAVVHSPI